MIYLKALLLSLIQSVAEFLPISSSAHLILISNYIQFDETNKIIFNIFIQFASTLAIICFFWKKLLNITLNIFNDKKSFNFILNISISFLPSSIINLLFYSYIKKYLYTNLIIAFTLIIGGILIIIIENIVKYSNIDNIDNINNKISFKIGICQIFSLIPGVSRSGSTIMGGYYFGLKRDVAVKFSFLLSIPITFAGAIYDLYKNYNLLLQVDFKLIFFGFFITFILSCLVMNCFINYISNNNFKIFAKYRIVLGLFIIIKIFI